MGKIYLIGAGPGAADLITVRGARLLEKADVVLYDALVEPELLELCPQKTQKILVGKRCGQHSVQQNAINQQLIEYAQTHHIIVRLKGGDPMLFGRADEEMRALEKAFIDYEVVPGVTAATAAAATLHRSLSLRNISRSVAFVTACTCADDVINTYDADTLVFYMSRHLLVKVAQQLLKQGKAQTTPLALVEACSTARERVLFMTLTELAQGKADQWLDTTQASLLIVGHAMKSDASIGL